MTKIRLAYRTVIDNSSTFLWDKYLFEDTYKEYLMQHQMFNNKENPIKTFRELLSENEKAQQLHFLTGIAAKGYVEQLKGMYHRVPDVLGNNFLPIINYQLDIINTDITDSSKHKIGITLFTPVLILIDIINNCYLVSKEIDKENNFETFMYPIQSKLSVCYYEK